MEGFQSFEIPASPSCQFSLVVAYSQIAVFQSSLENPFNEWTDRHVAQGFAWRPGSVSFGTLDGDGQISVRVQVTSHFTPSPSAVRVIQVPFRVRSDRTIEIATTTNSMKVELDEGEYLLVFEHGRGVEGRMWANFWFTHGTGAAAILSADPEISPDAELLMNAQPAAA